MKLQKVIMLDRVARLKRKPAPAHMPGNATSVALPSARPVERAQSALPTTFPLPTSRWGINETPPQPAVVANKPAKAPTAARWVRFESVAPEARAVFVAGSFNEWNPSATPMMRLRDRKWVKELWLSAGCYESLFVVDGQSEGEGLRAQSFRRLQLRGESRISHSAFL